MKDEFKAAWDAAGRELRIEVHPGNPAVGLPDDPRREIFLPEFGSPQGMFLYAVSPGEEIEPLSDDIGRIKEAGYSLSVLSRPLYSHFDFSVFTEALNYWGWNADESRKPAWVGDPEQGAGGNPISRPDFREGF